MRPADIKIGTSGWKFEDWAGVFYPHRVPQTKWLEYYAARFPVGEINSTYYRIARVATYEAIAKRTPARFQVLAKVHGDVTHIRDNPANSLRLLLAAFQPLIESEKLIGLLAQFPASFRYSPVNVDYVFRLRDSCQSIPLCVEFRHKEWLCDEVFASLNDHNLVWVTPDEPPLSDLLPFRPLVTSHFYYIRMHGRNANTWYNSQAGNRYDYNYSEEQLKKLGNWLLAPQTDGVKGYVLFNNCHLGQAPSNAWWLKTWLEEQDSSNTDRETDIGFDLSSD